MSKTKLEYEQKTLLEMVYMHECGHALMAALLNISIQKIDMNTGNNDFPATHVDPTAFNSLAIPDKINFYMAGYAAEEIYVGLVSKDESHFAYPYARSIFNQTSISNAKIDIDKVKKLLELEASDFLDIEPYGKLAVTILAKYRLQLGKLFVALVKSNGELGGKQILSITSTS